MESVTPLPRGTVTFLFTDIEGSTRLWEEHPEAMEVALARHDALSAAIVSQHAGRLVKQRGEGDSLFAVFARVADAVAAAAALQRALCTEPWAAETPLRVRMALHTGDAALREGDYYGGAVNRCARLRAVAHGGQILLSQTTYDLVRDQLPAETSLRDMGSHRLRDLQQPERIYRLLHPELPADFPLLRSLEAIAHNLPAQLTSFVGREKEMAEVQQLLTTTHLLTLTGAGGCGKTRLALQVAADRVEEYRDGVWLIELAALADPTLVPQTVASASGVREEPGRALTQTLVDHLRPKSLLLVLDNCEHLLAACAQLADTLLRACPRLRILASSREGLGIAGERTYRVPSLSLPDPTHLPPVERLTEYESVHLFVERAVFSQPSFVITDQNARAVAQVCQRLDGIPLAIELAAARVKALSVEKLNERLDDMFRLLTGGSRTALPRQQTLRALIDWSYDLLSPSEQAMLRRLSVFAGGWTLEAAEAVCSGVQAFRRSGVHEEPVPSDLKARTPERLNALLEEWEVLDLLTSLVEKSLVLYEEGEGEGRYRLLETVRQYARERRIEAGEAAAVEARHRDWCLELAAAQRRSGEGEKERLDRLEREHDNLRAALAWSVSDSASPPSGVEAGLRLATAFMGLWHRRGYWTEGRDHLLRLLALPGAKGPTKARARALHDAGILADKLGDRAAARSLFEEARSTYHELDDSSGVAASLYFLGFSECAEGDLAAARALFEESLAIRRAQGHTRRIADLLGDRGIGTVAHDQSDWSGARVSFEEALALYRELGDRGAIAAMLLALGRLAQDQGDGAAARDLLEQSMAAYEKLEDWEAPWSRGEVPISRGHVFLELGDYAAARSCYEEGLALRSVEAGFAGIATQQLAVGHVAWLQGEHEAARSHARAALRCFREVASQEWILAALESLGVVNLAERCEERAARLLGAAEALRRGLRQYGPWPWWCRPRRRIEVAVRTASLDREFAAAWAGGQALTLDEAIKLALED